MPRRRNPNGLGSVYRRKDGYWVAVATIGGKRIYTYHRSEKEARQKVGETLREYQFGTFASPTKTTVHEFAEQWIAAVEAGLKPKTFVGHQSLCRLYVDPALGHLKLHQLRAANVVAALASWRKRGSVTRPSQ